MDVVDLLRERDTRDELGIGTVRDALSDLLFPGTSTIQTRPRYFLLVPWVFHTLETWASWETRTLPQLQQDARRRELGLLRELVKADDTEGVIGREAGRRLQRLPSSIYWNGLDRWGIRFFRGSLSQMLRVLRHGAAGRTFVEVEGDEAPIDERGLWHAGLPERPRYFPKDQTLELSRDEALYLQDRIHATVGNTLLAWLVDRGDTGGDVEAPWEHPLVGELPPELARQLEHARVFSELMHGAAFLYNLMLAQKANLPERIDQHGERLAAWAEQVRGRRPQLAAWDRGDFWSTVFEINPHIPPASERFINDWMDLALGTADPSTLRDSSEALDLIRLRELRLKGLRRARLEDSRALDLWSGDAGTGRNIYRWNIVQNIVRDIRAGLDREAGDA
jgi:hypothetical protein